MAGGLDTVIAVVQRWLDVDRDVLVRGDDGSGRSTTLQTLMNDAVKQGVLCVLIDARRAAWRASRTVADAVPFLQAVKRRLPADEIDEVFATTRPSEEDPEELRARFRLTQGMWIAVRGDPPDVLAAHVEASRSEVGSHRGLLDLLHLAVTTHRRLTIDELDSVGDVVATTGSPVARGWFALFPVSTLVEAARLDDALDELDAVPADGYADPVARYLEGKRTDVLLLDRVEEAERWSRRRIEAAYDALDPVGIPGPCLGVGTGTGLPPGPGAGVADAHHGAAAQPSRSLRQRVLRAAALARRDRAGAQRRPPPRADTVARGGELTEPVARGARLDAHGGCRSHRLHQW